MKDAKGHGSEKRGDSAQKNSWDAKRGPYRAGGLVPKTPTLHEEASMRAMRSAGMSAQAINSHPDFGGRYNVPTVNAVTDRQAAGALAQGGAKSVPVDTHPAMGRFTGS